MRSHFIASAMLLFLFLPACAPLLGRTREPAYVGNGPGVLSLPPQVVYQDGAGPLAYRATVAGRGQVLREVSGEACQSALTFPLSLLLAAIESGSPARAAASLSVGWGDGGYAEAVAEALRAAPQAQLVDARVDLRTRVILGVWRQQCVRVVGTVAAAP